MPDRRIMSSLDRYRLWGALMSVELADAKFVGVEPNRTDVVREAPPEGRKKPLAAEAPAPDRKSVV